MQHKKIFGMITIAALLCCTTACMQVESGGDATANREPHYEESTVTTFNYTSSSILDIVPERPDEEHTSEAPQASADSTTAKEISNPANDSGIVIIKYTPNQSRIYKSTGTFKCTPFKVTMDIIDPESGKVTNWKTFSSEETYSCSAGFYGFNNNTTEKRSYFSSDFTKLAATLTLEDGSVHIGWINESGKFTDVSSKITVSSDFGGITNHQQPRFWENYLYFKDLTNETVQIKRVPINSLSTNSVEIMVEDVKWGGLGVYPLIDGSICDDISAMREYYDVSMTYSANTNFFNDWISESLCVGTSDKSGTNDKRIYKYNLANIKPNSLEWRSEAVPLIPDIKGRENYSAVVSPECNQVAFLSILTTGTQNETSLFKVPIDGGDPIKVNTSFDFSAQYENYISLLDWK